MEDRTASSAFAAKGVPAPETNSSARLHTKLERIFSCIVQPYHGKHLLISKFGIIDLFALRLFERNNLRFAGIHGPKGRGHGDGAKPLVLSGDLNQIDLER